MAAPRKPTPDPLAEIKNEAEFNKPCIGCSERFSDQDATDGYVELTPKGWLCWYCNGEADS